MSMYWATFQKVGFQNSEFKPELRLAKLWNVQIKSDIKLSLIYAHAEILKMPYQGNADNVSHRVASGKMTLIVTLLQSKNGTFCDRAQWKCAYFQEKRETEGSSTRKRLCGWNKRKKYLVLVVYLMEHFNSLCLSNRCNPTGTKQTWQKVASLQ